MPTLPPHPDVDQLRRQAKELLRAGAAGDGPASERIHAVSEQVTLPAPNSPSPANTGSRAGPR